MSYETLTVEQSDAVATVTLNRPAKRNAINGAMFEELDAAFAHIAAEASIRSFVLTGAGGHFCSGVDLSALEELPRTPEEMRRRMERIHGVLARIMYCPKPGIAGIVDVEVVRLFVSTLVAMLAGALGMAAGVIMSGPPHVVHTFNNTDNASLAVRISEIS